MSDRHKPHFGRALNGGRGVPEHDVEGDLPGEPLDAHVPDVIGHAGAVADIGIRAGEHGKRVQELVDQDREIHPTAASKRRDGSR
jgi:hypothetical protein